MKRMMFCYTLMAFLSLVSVTSRPFATYHFAQHQDQIPHTPQANFDSTEGGKSIDHEGATSYGNEEEYNRSCSRLGSRPPNCFHKCEGCFPCDPVQIPATTDRLGVQIANYEPEGWKCKCGASFFNP